MIWTLSDGTVVHLGGKVEGASRFAERLRRDVELVAQGTPPNIAPLPHPSSEPLDLNDPWHVHCWVRERAYTAGLRHGGWVEAERVHVVSAPELEAPEWDEPHDPDAIY